MRDIDYDDSSEDFDNLYGHNMEITELSVSLVHNPSTLEVAVILYNEKYTEMLISFSTNPMYVFLNIHEFSMN